MWIPRLSRSPSTSANRPAVKQAGDTVTKGELLAAAAEGALSANIHSSVNGVIEEITDKGARIRCRKE